MELNILINNDCIKCGKCVDICIANIFTTQKQETPSIDNTEFCITCGHCVAVCPKDAISHSEFPEAKVHKLNMDLLASSDQLMETIRSRRSNRTFTKEPIPMDFLQKIVEAGHRAPTASNMQMMRMTVVTSPEKLKEVSEFTVDTFAKTAKLLQNPFLKPVLKQFIGDAYRYVPLFVKMKSELEKGNDLILRNANALVFFHSPKRIMFGCEDCNLAYQNASLMAESLGVAQFYTGFVCSASKRSSHKKLSAILGTNDIVYAGMALGMPKFSFNKYIDKKDIEVKFI